MYLPTYLTYRSSWAVAKQVRKTFVDTDFPDSRPRSPVGTSDTPQDDTPTVVVEDGETLTQDSILLDGPILPQTSTITS